MNLSLAASEARVLMSQHGLSQQGWRFVWDGAKRRAGQCRYGVKEISLSRHLTALRSEADVRNTILHEIAHALVGPGAGHGPVWQRKAREIGCDANRTYTVRSQAERVEPNWVGVCPVGHVAAKRFRRPKNGREASCGICTPNRFDSTRVLRWVPFDSIANKGDLR